MATAVIEPDSRINEVRIEGLVSSPIVFKVLVFVPACCT